MYSCADKHEYALRMDKYVGKMSISNCKRLLTKNAKKSDELLFGHQPVQYASRQLCIKNEKTVSNNIVRITPAVPDSLILLSLIVKKYVMTR